MNDIEKLAREILVDALVRHHCIVTAAAVLNGGEVYGPGYEPNMRAALDAVVAALSVSAGKDGYVTV